MENITWHIIGLRTVDDPLEGTIVTASFLVTDGNSEAASDVRLKEAIPTSFVPLADITEDQVIAFVKAALGEEQVALYESLVTERTHALVPKIVTPLPWND